jgi:hypothetical protein
MQKLTLVGVARSVLLISMIALAVLGQAQSTRQRIPTAPQVAMQKKVDPKSHTGVMRGTTANERWQAAIKHADHRAAQIRAGHRG